MGTVAISLVRTVVDELARQRIDASALLAEAGIEASLLEDPSARVPITQYDRLQRSALDASADPAFGLHMGEHGSLSSFSTLGHMVAQCRTLGEAIELGLQYYRLVADVASAPTLVDRGQDIWFQYEYLRNRDPALDRLRAEFGLTRILAIGRLLLGEDALPNETWFEHDAPEYVAECARVFGGTAHFGKPSTGFLVPRALLERTHMHHDQGILGALREQANRSLERLAGGDGIANRVRRLLVDHHGEVRPEMDGIARALGISSRTLRRKLTSEGVGFQQIVDEAMRDVACSILRDPRRSIQEAAYELGFSDSSSFHRAFKRWTGVTPNEYRRQDTGH